MARRTEAPVGSAQTTIDAPEFTIPKPASETQIQMAPNKLIQGNSVNRTELGIASSPSTQKFNEFSKLQLTQPPIGQPINRFRSNQDRNEQHNVSHRKEVNIEMAKNSGNPSRINKRSEGVLKRKVRRNNPDVRKGEKLVVEGGKVYRESDTDRRYPLKVK